MTIMEKIYETPTSVGDFVDQTKGLFSTEFLQHFKEKCEAFDKLCGLPVADAFMGHCSHHQWAHIIAKNCLLSQLDKAEKHQLLQKSSEYVIPSSAIGQLDGTSYNPQQPSEYEDASLAICQFDGTSDTPQPRPPPPLTQIHLKGKDIKEAWANNPTALGISPFETLPLPDWTPLEIGGAPVFHGTSPHYKVKTNDKARSLDRALGSSPTSLHSSPGPSQIYPFTSKHSGIFTSFSAVRSFLWAVFLAEVIEDPPGPTPRSVLRKHFQMRGNTYHGVIVLQFDSRQPAPPPLSFYQIPIGQEWSWSRAAMPSTNPNFWREDVRSIHRRSTSEFPDVVHSKDLPNIHDALRSFPCSRKLLWQTAWMSEIAVRTLNENTANVYAISFELEEVELPTDKKEKKKTASGFARKFGHSLKQAFSSKDLRKQFSGGRE